MEERTLLSQIVSFRACHKEHRVLLGTLLGEISRDSTLNKTGDPKNPSDSDVIRIIKKMVEDNKITNTPQTLEENKVLSLFLPTQLTDVEINHFIKREVFQSIGECMQWFKTNYEGLYNGKQVSELFKKSKE